MLYQDAALTSNEITAFSNSIWGGSLLAVFSGLWYVLYIGRAELLKDTRNAIAWMMLSALGGAIHRAYWNIAIFTSPDGSNYAWWAGDQRKWLLIPILMIVFGLYGASVFLVPPRFRVKVAAICALWLVFLSASSIWLA